MGQVGLAAGAVLGATVVFAPGAQAATFPVTTTDDELDGGSTPCTDDPGDCSLREAAFEASDASGADTITFAAGITGEIELDPSLDAIDIINDSLSIQGPGADVLTVSGEDQTRIFKLFGFDAPDHQVTISGLTLANGLGESTGGFPFAGYGGAALYSGEGISPGPPVYAADVTIADSVLTDNATETGDSAFSGGAIKAFYGDLTITNSVLSDNYAYSSGGAIFSDEGSLTITGSVLSGNETAGQNGDYGGAVFVEDTAGEGGNEIVIADSALSANYAHDGAGAYIQSADGDTLVQRTTFTAGRANDEGGGLVHSSGEGDGLTIEATTFSNNAADSDGDDDGGAGALWIRDSYGPVAIRNSTFSGNSAYYGGAIASFNDYDVPVTVTNSTIVGNSASASDFAGGGGIWRDASNGGAPGDDTIDLSSTIVANNSAPVGPDLSDADGSDDGSFRIGFSLVESTADAIVAEAPAGSNIFGVDPLLGPLANNGGPTQTHLPAVTGPALDKGIANGLATDQRGLARTSDLGAIANATGGDGTDIGSVEIQAADCQGQGALRLDGTEGDDGLIGTDGPDAITLLGGNDSASGLGANDCVSGDEGRDRLSGGPGTDLVSGGAGKDRAKGNGGKDKVKGGPGKDKLLGGGGKDRLAGAGGKDRLSGGGGKDRLKGGPGKDKLIGGGGKDRFNCGGGTDKVTAQAKDKVSASCEKVVEKG